MENKIDVKKAQQMLFDDTPYIKKKTFKPKKKGGTITVDDVIRSMWGGKNEKD